MNLRRDPFERADFNSNTYFDWMVDHVPQMYLMQAVIAGQIEDFAKFPPRQKPASFNLDAVLEQVKTPALLGESQSLSIPGRIDSVWKARSARELPSFTNVTPTRRPSMT